MQVFNFSPSDYAAEFASKGYVVIRNGVDPEFWTYLQDFAAAELARSAALSEWEIKGKKQQFLFDFPDEQSLLEAKRHICGVTGLSFDDFFLCERHIKVYDAEAPPNPPPHKDRVASQVAVGLPLAVPKGSHMVLYPEHHVERNPFNSTALLRTSLDVDQLPEKLLADVEPVILDVQPRDVVMFHGSAVYHERVNPANTQLLYLKFNEERMDPLGEDPATGRERAETVRLLEQTADSDLLNLRLTVSPRLDRISRHYQRPHWREVIQAHVWGEKEITLSELELRLIRQIEHGRTVRQVLARLGWAERDMPGHLPALRRLIRLDALGLMPGR